MSGVGTPWQSLSVLSSQRLSTVQSLVCKFCILCTYQSLFEPSLLKICTGARQWTGKSGPHGYFSSPKGALSARYSGTRVFGATVTQPSQSKEVCLPSTSPQSASVLLHRDRELTAVSDSSNQIHRDRLPSH